jgi:pimeloyl-ACP methyl ester carboxylesterase
MWRAWFAPLAAAGYRAIAVDLPGHGLSDKPASTDAYRLDGLVRTVRELLDAERRDRVDIVAHSMAGTIALELALSHDPRIAHLALVNPASFGLVRIQALARAVSPSLVDVVLPRLLGRWLVARAHRFVYGDPSRLTPRDNEEYWAPSQFPSFARAMRRLLHDFPWTRPPVGMMAERLRSLDVPALVVLGTRDRLVQDAASYGKALRDAGAPLIVREVQGGGHAVNEERAEEVVPLVLAFLRDRLGPPSATGQHSAR